MAEQEQVPAIDKAASISPVERRAMIEGLVVAATAAEQAIGAHRNLLDAHLRRGTWQKLHESSGSLSQAQATLADALARVPDDFWNSAGEEGD
jgi:hypothetical protein